MNKVDYLSNDNIDYCEYIVDLVNSHIKYSEYISDLTPLSDEEIRKIEQHKKQEERKKKIKKLINDVTNNE